MGKGLNGQNDNPWENMATEVVGMDTTEVEAFQPPNFGKANDGENDTTVLDYEDFRPPSLPSTTNSSTDTEGDNNLAVLPTIDSEEFEGAFNGIIGDPNVDPDAVFAAIDKKHRKPNPEDLQRVFGEMAIANGVETD